MLGTKVADSGTLPPHPHTALSMTEETKRACSSANRGCQLPGARSASFDDERTVFESKSRPLQLGECSRAVQAQRSSSSDESEAECSRFLANSVTCRASEFDWLALVESRPTPPAESRPRRLERLLRAARRRRAHASVVRGVGTISKPVHAAAVKEAQKCLCLHRGTLLSSD